MTILVLNQSLRAVGGTETYVRRQIEALAALGHRVVAISADPGDTAEVPGLARRETLPDLFTSSWRPGVLWRSRVAARALARLLDAERPSVALSHLFVGPAPMRTLLRRLPVVSFVHTAWPYCPAGTRWLRVSNSACHVRPGLRCLAVDRAEACMVTTHGERYALKDALRRIADLRFHRAVFRRAALVVANSEYTAGELRRTMPGPMRLAVVPPPVPESTAVPRAPRPGQLLFVGRLISEKGAEDALRAVAKVPGARLVLVGDGPLRPTLEGLATHLGVSDRVAFEGWRSKPEIDQAMQDAEAVLFPSRWPEPFGMVGPETFTNGRPVIGYATGGATTWLDATSGLVVAPGDIDGLAAALRTLLADQPLRQRLCEGARARAARFSVAAFSEQLRDVLARAVQARSATTK